MPMHLEVSMPRRIQISNWMQSCSITFMVVRSRIACKLHSITCFCDYLFVDELIVNLFAKSLWTSRGCILHCRLTVLKTGSNGLLSGLLIFIMTADERRRREYIVDTTTTTLVWRTFSTNHLLGRASDASGVTKRLHTQDSQPTLSCWRNAGQWRKLMRGKLTKWWIFSAQHRLCAG